LATQHFPFGSCSSRIRRGCKNKEYSSKHICQKKRPAKGQSASYGPSRTFRNRICADCGFPNTAFVLSFRGSRSTRFSLSIIRSGTSAAFVERPCSNVNVLAPGRRFLPRPLVGRTLHRSSYSPCSPKKSSKLPRWPGSGHGGNADQLERKGKIPRTFLHSIFSCRNATSVRRQTASCLPTTIRRFGVRVPTAALLKINLLQKTLRISAGFSARIVP
jgi:hypothetical protein